MKLRPLKSVFAASLLFSAGIMSAQAASWEVDITNLTHGIHFTPLLVTAHDSSAHLFQSGMAASTDLKAMAECGDTSALLTTLGGADDDTIDNPAAGLLAPGTSTMATITTTNNYLSLVAMMLPTNDGFVGMDAMMIPSDAGTYTFYLNSYDAGSEANDELMDTSGCAPGMAGIPGAPGSDVGTGGSGVASADSNTMIHIHRGVFGDSNPAGGSSDLDNTIHRWQNPVAKVVVTVTP